MCRDGSGHVLCQRGECRGLASEKPPKRHAAGKGTNDIIRSKECRKCKKHRASRALVAQHASDARFLDESFIACPAIFANNDLKYEANKLRAKLFSKQRDEAITYCPAKDNPTPEALRERPDLPTQKLAWLQRHDRERVVICMAL